MSALSRRSLHAAVLAGMGALAAPLAIAAPAAHGHLGDVLRGPYYTTGARVRRFRDRPRTSRCTPWEKKRRRRKLARASRRRNLRGRT